MSIHLYFFVSQHALTWALVVPTYQRQNVLLRCLRLAAQQSWLAKEIIVVDASDNWAETHSKIMQGLALEYPAIDWQHVHARALSSAIQRNQGIELATADIIFLIDDDALMYPDCAQVVMDIYCRDEQHHIAGIMPILAAVPPDVTHSAQHTQSHVFTAKLNVFKMRVRQWAKRFIKDDNIFLPYDFSFPRYTVPDSLQGLAIHCVPMFHGARMSYRRHLLTQIRFEETLMRYAVNEDNDVCYRASRSGMLVQALNARICHLQSGEGRVSRFSATVLWGLNQIVLHRFHSPDFERFQTLFSRLLWRRLMTQALKDILDRRWSLPAMRGIWFILRHRQQFFAKTAEELRLWYPEFQQQLIDQDAYRKNK